MTSSFYRIVWEQFLTSPRAYADVYDIMDMTEELVSGLVKHITGGTTTKYHTQHGDEYEINCKFSACATHASSNQS